MELKRDGGPPIALSLGKSVVAVELFDLESNQRIGTFHRERSCCTFSEKIQHDHFEIVLRLDWGDSHEGEPMLDLDVVQTRLDGSRETLKPRDIPAHHTSLSDFVPGSSAPRFYDLTYMGLRLRVIAKKTFASSIGASVLVVDPGLSAGG